ncbi:MAG: hypothetical protein ACKPBV_18375, partial [Sphaerospermopsis kisseleviana]
MVTQALGDGLALPVALAREIDRYMLWVWHPISDDPEPLAGTLSHQNPKDTHRLKAAFLGVPTPGLLCSNLVSIIERKVALILRRGTEGLAAWIT